MYRRQQRVLWRSSSGTPATAVTVSSQGDVDITGANGEFTLTGLSVPYESATYTLLLVPVFPGAVVGVTAFAGPDIRFVDVMGAAAGGATLQVPDSAS